MAHGVYTRFVVSKRAQFLVAQKLQLGNTNTVFAADHTVQATRQRHNAFDRLMRQLQHGVIVRVHRNIGVDVAVTRVHVQRYPYAAFEHALVDAI